MKIDRGYNEYNEYNKQVNLAAKQNVPVPTNEHASSAHVAKLFDFSSTAQQIAHPTAATNGEEHVDHAKLMAIRSQIMTGEYKVDIDKLATKLTAEMHDQQK
ncbi:flagellar biosynthesis anti-sigma factor FlgM [Periweissella fabalis]|uniref:Negative regulator of flagellin synthesis n=1 Tax=Periweissella fabalis TaxID=1070421 RepID=A0A7X6S2X2_9LACO|nr:flagellar biosynthesis anti-sigma factor FlgM [Periweissella fabalis]MCM0599957.1 flagellar biosynthesis anti-sigma factor FlgM [Periweissella fabalis]NKZ23988.1 flagellar biosynthesis anti-sigma factor FlgM [Periweissella fabalis]